MVLRVSQQGLDPGVVGVLGAELLLEQELAQQDADADVGERPEGEDAVRRADEPVDLRVLRLDPRDDVADRLVDERQPDFLRVPPCGQDRSGLALTRSPCDLRRDEDEQSGEEAAERRVGQRHREGDASLGGRPRLRSRARLRHASERCRNAPGATSRRAPSG